ncbi:hypothetical protein E2C01_030402 [Portunus trituberculatus]|uniref:Uncharacterized protein n=1 Tax=Portunus trituberculatus TaxID=210409 RepID=A0A5B7EVM6_PORTR|nr:hypothetical protein [Portunus trituberculatus]
MLGSCSAAPVHAREAVMLWQCPYCPLADVLGKEEALKCACESLCRSLRPEKPHHHHHQDSLPCTRPCPRRGLRITATASPRAIIRSQIKNYLTVMGRLPPYLYSPSLPFPLSLSGPRILAFLSHTRVVRPFSSGVTINTITTTPLLHPSSLSRRHSVMAAEETGGGGGKEEEEEVEEEEEEEEVKEEEEEDAKAYKTHIKGTA